MKNQTGIWIDKSIAKVVTISDDNIELSEIESGIENRIHHDGEGNSGSFMGSQHISNEKTFEERESHQINNFLDEIVGNISEANEIIVIGPAEMKNKLKNRIENDNKLRSRLLSVETADSMTDNQLKAKIKECFSESRIKN